MIQEIAVNPQMVLSSAQGYVGTRRWVLDPCDNLCDFLRLVGDSRWPDGRTKNKGVFLSNVVPISITVGPLDERATIIEQGKTKRKVTGREEDRTLGDLPVFSKTLVTAQYQFLHIRDAWPSSIPKPKHARNTTLSLRIRNSGQFLVITPQAIATPGGGWHPVIPTSNICRILIPIVEYHITCDRLTLHQFNKINPAEAKGSNIPFKSRMGSVNRGLSRHDDGMGRELGFLGAHPGTLLFDSCEVDQTFVPDVDNPVRYRITCVMRMRQVCEGNGYTSEVVPRFDPDGRAIGWNHDFGPYRDSAGKDQVGWHFIWLKNDAKKSPTDLAEIPRYPYQVFDDMFCLEDPEEMARRKQRRRLGLPELKAASRETKCGWCTTRSGTSAGSFTSACSEGSGSLYRETSSCRSGPSAPSSGLSSPGPTKSSYGSGSGYGPSASGSGGSWSGPGSASNPGSTSTPGSSASNGGSGGWSGSSHSAPSRATTSTTSAPQSAWSGCSEGSGSLGSDSDSQRNSSAQGSGSLGSTSRHDSGSTFSGGRSQSTGSGGSEGFAGRAAARFAASAGGGSEASSGSVSSTTASSPSDGSSHSAPSSGSTASSTSQSSSVSASPSASYSSSRDSGSSTSARSSKRSRGSSTSASGATVSSFSAKSSGGPSASSKSQGGSGSSVSVSSRRRGTSSSQSQREPSSASGYGSGCTI